MRFNKNFIWGVATAAYQIEGAAFDDNKGRNIWDDFCRQPGKINNNDTGDIACDFYHRYLDDIKLIKELGVKAYRFSLSWSRILPDGIGSINQKGIDFYNSVIDELLKNDIVPYITLYHWDYPSKLMEKGGWLNPQSTKWFENYAKVVAEAFGDRVKHFITFNEPQAFVGLGYCSDLHAPGLNLSINDSIKVCHNVLIAHGLAVKKIRDIVTDSKIGYAPCCDVCIPYTDEQEDILAAKERFFDMNDDIDSWVWSCAWWSDPVILGTYPKNMLKRLERFLPDNYEKDYEIICQPLDFYCQNIYKGFLYKRGNDGRPEQVPFEDGYPYTVIGWPNTPKALYWGPKFLYERYKLPFIITENGISCFDKMSPDGKVHDKDRIEYMNNYIKELFRAAEDGVDVVGYFAWSLMDNFEWAEGYEHRFGLIYINYDNLKRTPKDSYYWYRELINDGNENDFRK